MNLDLPRIRSAITTKLDYLNPHYANARSTLKTSLGFMGTLVKRWLPQRWQADNIESIFNYLPITDLITTAGQPTETQFVAVKNAGFVHVINLAPHGLENALKDEQAVLAALQLGYTHIPVDFKQPTETDFAQFCAAMQQFSSQKILVHCAANMRVSAFMFRYRTQVLGEPVQRVRQDLNTIWEPFGVWEKFIATTPEQTRA